jgi:hypothetical protein
MGLHDPLSGSRVILQGLANTGRARAQLAGAIGAAALKALDGAVLAERAFERADDCIRAIGRQVTVTTFTVGAQFEHGHGLYR